MRKTTAKKLSNTPDVKTKKSGSGTVLTIETDGTQTIKFELGEKNSIIDEMIDKVKKVKDIFK